MHLLRPRQGLPAQRRHKGNALLSTFFLWATTDSAKLKKKNIKKNLHNCWTVAKTALGRRLWIHRFISSCVSVCACALLCVCVCVLVSAEGTQVMQESPCLPCHFKPPSVSCQTPDLSPPLSLTHTHTRTLNVLCSRPEAKVQAATQPWHWCLVPGWWCHQGYRWCFFCSVLWVSSPPASLNDFFKVKPKKVRLSDAVRVHRWMTIGPNYTLFLLTKCGEIFSKCVTMGSPVITEGFSGLSLTHPWSKEPIESISLRRVNSWRLWNKSSLLLRWSNEIIIISLYCLYSEVTLGKHEE